MAWTEESRSVSPAIAAEIIAELQPDNEREGIWSRISRRLFAGK
jgi:hypothetical protein